MSDMMTLTYQYKIRREQKFLNLIARIRKDVRHKISHSLTSNNRCVFLGNLKLVAGKAVNDASHGMLKIFCEYKAIRRRGMCVLVNEAYTTVTCNFCLAKTGPQGLEGLAVREWTCGCCGQSHHRDINSAKNILRIGLDTLETSGKLLANQSKGIPPASTVGRKPWQE
jgi:putative transposase